MLLGEMIADHCSRCKRTTDHAIVAMTGDDVVKVVCRSCNSEHKYRHNKTGKKEMTAESYTTVDFLERIVRFCAGFRDCYLHGLRGTYFPVGSPVL